MSDDCLCKKETGCSCDCLDEEKEENLTLLVGKLVVSMVLTLLAFLISLPTWLTWFIYLLAYIIVAGKIIKRALENLLQGELFDENFLMSIASLGALLIGDQLEAVSVIVFYQLGELLQEVAVRKSKKRIVDLLKIAPDTTNVKRNNKIVTVLAESVKINEIIIVKAGEVVALDGKVTKGTAYLDTSALTGESLPLAVKKGTEVLAGMIDLDGLLEIEVKRSYQDSTLTKILELVEHSGKKKARSETFITRFARVYTPIVVGLALVIMFLAPLFFGGDFNSWIYRGLSFLIVSCPCALVISIPLSFFGAIGGAAHQGILIKSGLDLESLHQLETLVFDKTGTLTKGQFKVREVVSKSDYSVEALLQLAASLEVFSNHSIAKAIVKANQLPTLEVSHFKEEAGLGINATIKTEQYYVGSSLLLSKIGIKTLPQTPTSVVHLAKANQYLGYISLVDEEKENLSKIFSDLKKEGIKKLIMLSGDKNDLVREVAEKLGFDEYYGQLLPLDKVELFTKIKEENGGLTAFIGDGINDAPVLKMADLGIAMGAIGSDAAIAAADMVIMNDDLAKLVSALRIAKKTQKIVKQNISLALVVKIMVMVLASLGISSLWFAIFADVGVALLALFNALRVMKVDKSSP